MVTWAGRRRRSATISNPLAEGPAYITAILRSTSVSVFALGAALGTAAQDETSDTATEADLLPDDDAAISALASAAIGQTPELKWGITGEMKIDW